MTGGLALYQRPAAPGPHLTERKEVLKMSSNALKEAPVKDGSKTTAKVADLITPNWRQHAKPIQKYGTVVKDLPIGLDASARQEIAGRLNLLLADTITLRDLYKKSHWQ